MEFPFRDKWNSHFRAKMNQFSCQNESIFGPKWIHVRAKNGNSIFGAGNAVWFFIPHFLKEMLYNHLYRISLRDCSVFFIPDFLKGIQSIFISHSLKGNQYISYTAFLKVMLYDFLYRISLRKRGVMFKLHSLKEMRCIFYTHFLKEMMPGIF